MMKEHEINTITSLVDKFVFKKFLWKQPHYLKLKGGIREKEDEIWNTLKKIDEATRSCELSRNFDDYITEMFDLLSYSTDTAFFLGLKMGYALSGAENTFGEIDKILTEILEKTLKEEC